MRPTHTSSPLDCMPADRRLWSLGYGLSKVDVLRATLVRGDTLWLGSYVWPYCPWYV